MSKRIEAAILTDDEIKRLQDEVLRIASYGPYLQEQFRLLDERVSALEDAPPPVEPPVEPEPRQDVIYFSGAESGPSWPSNSADVDGWSRQNFTSHKDEALQLCLARDHDIPARSGDRVFRAFYDVKNWGEDSNGKYRSELLEPAKGLYDNDVDYWVGFSFFLKDNENNRKMVQSQGQLGAFAQWHTKPSDGPDIWHFKDGRFNIKVGQLPVEWCGPCELGVWHDFVLSVKFTTNANQGYGKIWHKLATEDDYTVIYDKTGQTVKSGINYYQKLGFYRADDGMNGATYGEQFYDEFRIATGPNANFNSVRPG